MLLGVNKVLPFAAAADGADKIEENVLLLLLQKLDYQLLGKKKKKFAEWQKQTWKFIRKPT